MKCAKGEKISTNSNGKTSCQVIIKKNSRILTIGEILMARQIFKDSINYSLVRVHKDRYMVGTGSSIMTPNGEIYYPDESYSDDFSHTGIDDKAIFIHEMVHVWQYQLGYSVKWAGIKTALSGGYKRYELGSAYEYDYFDGAKFQDYDMEQQGMIVQCYFGAEIGMSGAKFYTARLKENKAILVDFLKNPNDKMLLPQKKKISLKRTKERSIYDSK